MNITCDQCHKSGKGRYSSFIYEGKVITLCQDCRWGERPKKTEKQIFDELQIPFWKLMGQKPKPKDIAYEKYLKSRNMTYGDAVLERSLHGTERSAYEQFKKTR